MQISTAELTKLQRRQSQKATKITQNVQLKFLNERCKNVTSLTEYSVKKLKYGKHSLAIFSCNKKKINKKLRKLKIYLASEYTIYDISLQDPNSFRASSTAHHGQPPPLTAALEASLRNYNALRSSEQL